MERTHRCATAFFFYLKLPRRKRAARIPAGSLLTFRRTETDDHREDADRFGEIGRLIAAIRDQLVDTCIDLPIAL